MHKSGSDANRGWGRGRWLMLLAVTAVGGVACGDDDSSGTRSDDQQDSGLDASDDTAADDPSSDDVDDDGSDDPDADDPSSDDADDDSSDDPAADDPSDDDDGPDDDGADDPAADDPSSDDVDDDSASRPDADDVAADDGDDDDAPPDDAVSDDAPPPDAGGPEPDASTPEDHSAELLVARMLGELGLGESDEPWVANVTRAPLGAQRVIAPFAGSSAFTPSGDYSFMFLDRMPNARYSHPTQFVFAEAGSDLVVEDHAWWPELDGVGFVTSDVELVKLFSPDTSGVDQRPYPGLAGEDHRRATTHTPILAFYPNYTEDTGSVRLFFRPDASFGPQGMGMNVNLATLFVDQDVDGQWDPEDRVLFNSPVTVSDDGWAFTEPFSISAGVENGFDPELWLRLSLSDLELPDSADPEDYCSSAASLGCSDEYYDTSTWSGSDCGAESEYSGCSATITWGPQLDNPPVPEIEGVESSYVCQPDGIEITTLTKALVINGGDTPGRSDSEHEMNKVAALFSLRFGDDAVAKMNTPTADRTLEAVREFVAGLSCLDEAHLYITAHGYPETGNLSLVNGHGSVSPAQLREAITSSNSHCPSPMQYAISENCRQGGYCNLNVYFTSCYSGHFLQGENSLALPGLNVLTAASASSPAYAKLTGVETGENVGHAFVEAFVDGKGDAAPYGDGDGVTTADEAQRYAIVTYQGINTDPQLSQLADCACSCATNACGNGVVEEGEACDTALPNGCPETGDFYCNEQCQCECDETYAEYCEPFEDFDVETCRCEPRDHCPPIGSFLLRGSFSLYDDDFGHNPYHDIPLGTELPIDFTRTNGMFTSPGAPTWDIPALSGTITNDPSTGCWLGGSGRGVFAGYSNSECILEDGLILDGVFSGFFRCTPSAFPNQPIIFNWDAAVELPE